MMEREVCLQTLVSGYTHSIALSLIRTQRNHGRRELLDVSGLDQHSRFAVLDDLRCRTAVRGDNRFAVMHRLQEDNAESFTGAGQRENIARFIRSPQRALIKRTEKLYAVCHSQVRGDSLVPFQITPAANDKVFQVRHARVHGGQRFDDGIDTLVLLASNTRVSIPSSKRCPPCTRACLTWNTLSLAAGVIWNGTRESPRTWEWQTA